MPGSKMRRSALSLWQALVLVHAATAQHSVLQQVHRWAKDAADYSNAQPCTKAAPAAKHDEAAVLVQMVDCATAGATKEFLFEGGGFSKDGYFRGTGYLQVWRHEIDTDLDDDSRTLSLQEGTGGKMRMLTLEETTKEEDRQTRLCVLNRRLFGRNVNRYMGTFANGRPNGETRVVLSGDRGVAIVKMTKGVPSGRFRLFSSDQRLQFVGHLLPSGSISGPCWDFRSEDGTVLFGHCDGLMSFAPGKELLVIRNDTEEVIAGVPIADRVLGNCNQAKLGRFELDNYCLPKLDFAKASEGSPFKYNIHQGVRYPLAGDNTNENALCASDDSAFTEKGTAQSLLQWLQTLSESARSGADVLWMLEADSQPLDKKRVSLLSEVEHVQGKTYEAVITIGGLKEAVEFEYRGSVDADGVFAGHGVIKVAAKKMCLRKTCRIPTVRQLSGNFVGGLLEGRVKVEAEFVTTFGSARQGCLHGVVVQLGVRPTYQEWDGDMQFYEESVSFIGRYLNGKPTGKVWMGLLGGGYLYGQVDAKHPDSITDEKAAFVYPDLETAIVGTFERSMLKSGQSSKLIKQRCANGLREVEFSSPNGPTFSYEPPTSSSFGVTSTAKDAYEEANVEVREGKEGIFAARDLKAETMVAFFIAHKLNLSESSQFWRACETQSADELDECAKRAHILSAHDTAFHMFSSPKEAGSYVATVGQRVRRAGFGVNAMLLPFEHPRHGLVPAVVVLRDVAKGDEIVANYVRGKEVAAFLKDKSKKKGILKDEL